MEWLVLAGTLLLAFVNGANDNLKGVATLYGAGTLSYRRALALATVSTGVGALASSALGAGLVRAFSAKGLVPDAALTPDGQAVVVLANLTAVDSYELFRVECDGSEAPLRLHAPLAGGRDVADFAFSADGNRVGVVRVDPGHVGGEVRRRGAGRVAEQARQVVADDELVGRLDVVGGHAAGDAVAPLAGPEVGARPGLQ